MNYFEYLKAKENISFYEALEVFVPLFVKLHKWNVGDDVNKVKYEKYQLLEKLFIQMVEDKVIEGNIFWDYEYDQFDLPIMNGPYGPEKVVYYGKSYANAIELYEFMTSYLEKNNYDIPHDLKVLTGKINEEGKVAYNSDHVKEIEAHDKKYPKFDALDINNPEKELVLSLKKKYGELRTQKLEWDISLPIAVKLGIEFYEEGLERDVDRAAFKSVVSEKYPALFRSTIDKMFDALPPYFKSKGKKAAERAEINDEIVDTVIEASVVAGFLCHKNGVVKDVKELEERLEGDGYALPPHTYLKAIAGTCKRVVKKNK